MKYLKIQWHHEEPEYPNLIYSEINEERWETRKLEFFPGGKVGYAYNNVEVGGTGLGLEPIPSIKDISSDPEFTPEEITKGEFERVWNEHVNS